jgi:hypothetical protein
MVWYLVKHTDNFTFTFKSAPCDVFMFHRCTVWVNTAFWLFVHSFYLVYLVQTIC